MEKQATIKIKKPNQVLKEPMIPKGRYDVVNLALKDTKILLQERTAEADALRARVAELEEKLSCIVTIAKWFRPQEGESNHEHN